MASPTKSYDPAVDDFLSKLNLEELCNIASGLRQGAKCTTEGHTTGGFNVLQEITFGDGVTWLARIPRPDNSFQPEETTLSYASVLRYLKKHSNIPVPSVFGYATSSDKENTFGHPYILMEQLPGHILPTLDRFDPDASEIEDPTKEDLQFARKIHEQLTDIVIELACHRFDRIGALREMPSGEFAVVRYSDPFFTAYPKDRAAALARLPDHERGPYGSISEFYSCVSKLNLSQATNGPVNDYGPKAVADYETWAEMASEFVVPEFERGPFVINHNDLSVENILVDDMFNITGIIDFPGTVIPLPSHCVFPWLFHDNLGGSVVDRQAYQTIFTSRISDCQSSALCSVAVRSRLMETAINRNNYERALLGPYARLVLPHLYKRIYGKPYQRRGDQSKA